MTDSPPQPRGRRWGREAASLLALVVVLLAARSSVADHYRVPTGSMEPSVHVGDRVLVNKAAYDVRVPFTDASAVERDGPERGDVVVLDSPEDDKTLLKRVVGLPGDVVEVADGRVIINGESAPVTERDGQTFELLGNTEHPVSLGPDRGFGPVTVPAGHYLVLGDNRSNSRDGRSFGPVPRHSIRGRAFRVYWRDSGFAWRDL